MAPPGCGGECRQGVGAAGAGPARPLRRANYVHNVVDTPCFSGLCASSLVAVCKHSPKNVAFRLDLDGFSVLNLACHDLKQMMRHACVLLGLST